MFAAFQAGAWRSLAGQFQPDAIFGASAGALNAWCIASRIDPERLCHFWVHLDEQGASPRLRMPRYFGDGILDATGLTALLTRVTTEFRPQIPLAITVCEGPRLQNRVYWNDEITVDHLLASCAVPGLLPAKRLAGGLSFDGGLRGACPVWAAQDWGADEIIAIDVWPGLGFRKVVRPAHIRYIEPPQRLGPLHQAFRWNAANATRWVAMGEAAAR